MTKNNHNDVKSSSKSANFQFFAEGGNYVPVNRWFFDAREQGQLTNQEFLTAVIFLEWSFSKYKISTFEISRHELARIAGVGHAQAYKTLQILVKTGVLKVVRKNALSGNSNVYRWNANMLKNQVGLSLTKTAPVSQKDNPLSFSETAPVSQKDSVYIEYISNIINIINNKYFNASCHDVDNSDHDENEVGDNMADSGESSISEMGTKRLAAWKLALASCGRGKHETKFWQLFNFFYYYEVPFEKIRNPMRWLTAIAKDNQTFYEMNKKSLYPFTNDDEFFEFITKSQGGSNESNGSSGEVSPEAGEGKIEVSARCGQSAEGAQSSRSEVDRY